MAAVHTPAVCRVWRWVIGIGAIGVVAAGAADVAATPAETPPTTTPTVQSAVDLFPGEYVGSNAIFADGLFADFGAGTVTADLTYEGEFNLTIDEDLTSSGDFVLGGNWNLELTSDGPTATSTGTTNGSGAISGSGTELDYDGFETTVFEVKFDGFSRPFDYSGPIPAVSFEIKSASCSEITGEWERAWEDVAAAVGYENPEILTGDFWAIRMSDAEQRARIERYFEEFAAASTDPSVDTDNIDTTGLPPIYREMQDLNRRSYALLDSNTPESGPAWIRLIDDAAELSERVRNTDPCVFGGRKLQRQDFTFPSTMVENAIYGLESLESYYDDASMRALAARAMEYNVVGPRSPNPEVSERALDEFQGWIDASAAQSEGDPVQAVDALIVGSALGLSVSSIGVGSGG